MRISHKNKFVFIAIPRTGSTSLRAALDNASEVKSVYKYEVTEDFPFYNHITASELREVFVTKDWNWSEYTKFAVVRNPFDRCVSLYHHRMETGGRYAVGKSKTYNFMRKMKYKYGAKKSFKEWLGSSDAEINMCASISEFANAKDGEELVNEFILFENIYEDFLELSGKIGISSQTDKLLKQNSSKAREDYRSYYDEETIEFVNKKYSYEIDRFNYKF